MKLCNIDNQSSLPLDFGASASSVALMSSASEDLTEESTKVNSDVSILSDDHKGLRQRIALHIQNDTTPRDILLFLIAFRILNALSVRTFFQPDEYFQGLEPAWRIAFGEDSGTWITWVPPPWHLLHIIANSF
jgi:hypothetical protein